MEITIKDLPIFYEERGEGQLILFLHGQPTDHTTMIKSFEPVLEGRAYRRIYVDLPGMGKTPGADWIQGNDDVLDLMSDLLQRFAGREQFLLVGFSFGGYLARALAYRHREQCDGLLLLAPAITTHAEGRNLPDPNVVVKNPDLFADLPEAIQASFKNAIAVQTPEVVRRAREEIMPALLSADHEFLGRIRPNARLSESDAINAMVYEKPSLFLLGRQDSVTGYQDAMALHDRYPRASIVTLDRCGHGPQMDQRVLFEALVRDWLFRVEEMAERVRAEVVRG